MDNNNTESQSRQLGAAFLVIGWIAFIVLIALLLNHTLFATKTPSISETDAGKQITIYRDYDSHFRIKGNINGIPVTFLIDSGATSVAMSEAIANQSKLQKKAPITAQTAAGESVGYFTKIEEIEIGGITIHNVSGVIIPDFDSNEALLGMNVLSKFTMQQNKDTLILTVPNNNPETQ